MTFLFCQATMEYQGRGGAIAAQPYGAATNLNEAFQSVPGQNRRNLHPKGRIHEKSLANKEVGSTGLVGEAAHHTIAHLSVSLAQG
ncbi:MAG TPA: hypothetical protein PKA37_13480 [Planctomycetota bacterium]|nr:hypothetical protein [Planctomycetota bacterium]